MSSVRSLSRTSESCSEIFSKYSEVFAIACRFACGFQALPEGSLIEIPYVGVCRNQALELVPSHPLPTSLPSASWVRGSCLEGGVLPARALGPEQKLAGEDGLSLALCSACLQLLRWHLKASSVGETFGNTGRTTELRPRGVC